MENIFYMNYNGCAEISFDALIVAAWNTLAGDKKVFLNNKDFFENSFENAYDATLAVSLSDKWTWSDDFVCFDEEGYISSFTHWDDEKSPINIDKIDISHLIDGLKRWHNKQDKYAVNSIPIAIHEALK